MLLILNGFFDIICTCIFILILDIFDTLILESGQEITIYNNGGVPNGRLNFKFNHFRDQKRGGVVLEDGQVTYKLSEFVKADPFGIGGDVDIGQIFPAGTVDIRPVYAASPESN